MENSSRRIVYGFDLSFFSGCFKKTPVIYFFDDTKIVETIHTKGNEILTLPTAQKDGYTFLGWYLDPQRQQKVEWTLIITEDCTLYALWEENIAEITYSIQNGVITGLAIAPEGELHLVIPENIDGVAITGIGTSTGSVV